MKWCASARQSAGDHAVMANQPGKSRSQVSGRLASTAMTWMVTGGAGYIGAHVARALLASGPRGRRPRRPVQRLPRRSCRRTPPSSRRRSSTRPRVERTLREHRVTGVVHLAALKYAGVSVEQPLEFYDVNVTGTARLLSAMGAAGVDTLVFSSSAAVFGTPDVDLVTETTATTPESPYGETKLIGEWLLRDVARTRPLAAHLAALLQRGRQRRPGGARHQPAQPVSARAHGLERGPPAEGVRHRLPHARRLLRARLHPRGRRRRRPRGGRGAARGGRSRWPRPTTSGLGSGISVLEIFDAMRRVLGRDFAHEVAPRRPGDPARIVTSADLARTELGWSARYDLDEMVRFRPGAGVVEA